MLPVQRAQVRSLVGELTSHMPCSWAKKNQNMKWLFLLLNNKGRMYRLTVLEAVVQSRRQQGPVPSKASRKESLLAESSF